MLFRIYGQAVLTLHERHSRLLIAVRPPGKAASPIASIMTQVLGAFPPQWRRTVTFDNGTEFSRHHQLHDLGVETFFCDTHSPWQKGGVENAIGRMRRTLPRKTDLAELSDDRFVLLLQAYNNTPRKCLGYRTPAEIFSNQVLHLKCESTSQPRRNDEHLCLNYARCAAWFALPSLRLTRLVLAHPFFRDFISKFRDASCLLGGWGGNPTRFASTAFLPSGLPSQGFPLGGSARRPPRILRSPLGPTALPGFYGSFPYLRRPRRSRQAQRPEPWYGERPRLSSPSRLGS